MTVLSPGLVSAPELVDRTEPKALRRAWIRRADYLYILPALLAMLVVIAYPIYYTIELSFYATPPGLQLRDKIFVGLDNYALILRSDVFWRVTVNTLIWTVAST